MVFADRWLKADEFCGSPTANRCVAVLPDSNTFIYLLAGPDSLAYSWGRGARVSL
eukprot:CAMPEP_0182510110 /NCGR_PEP_ID=MMETSP1321-20130603/28047_1 /TAXON_ID=91990 /ORGANISM="Bolidomonas sp., Strain RCC1657" /LENGTH=54 /DNA_ID=CAMNT_0024716517 /DNA_START=1 /DNA_END=162 /DNA_ORIENTATION=+